MAVMTYTRRQIVDMLPELLTKRSASFAPTAKGIAEQAKLSEAALASLNVALALRDGDEVRRATFAFRSPYAVRRPGVESSWAELVTAGYAEPTPEGWRVLRHGVSLAEELSRKVRAHVSVYDLPKEATRRATEELERLAARIPATAKRAEIAARLPIPFEGAPADILRLDRAARTLWGFRDDCHIGAWQDAGYDGPAFEVLSFVWTSPSDVSWTKVGGHRTVDDLAKALAPRQDREDVEVNVETLVQRGDLERDGDAVRLTAQGQRSRDAIEDETDRRFFAIWDLDDAATSRLGDDLRTVIDALPKG